MSRARTRRSGSISQGRSLAISKSLVSAHLRALEETLGARLIERTTCKALAHTDRPEVLAATDRMLNAASEVTQIAETKQAMPTGVPTLP